jgi:ribonuclease BN (tRNA processing enzyme)
MDVTFLGVGEAFDPDEPNSCALIEADGFTLLIDCGHSTVGPIWRECPDPDRIDAIYVTHRHADHIVGLIPVLNRWDADGRRKHLTILSSEQVRGEVQTLLTAGSIPWDHRSPFPIRFALAGEANQIGPFACAFAPTTHSAPNHAIRLTHDGRTLAYSGDGRPTPHSAALYEGADLLLHECFMPERADHLPFHCDLPTASALAGPKRVGLYHIKAGERGAMRDAVKGDPRLFVPDAGTGLTV